MRKKYCLICFMTSYNEWKKSNKSKCGFFWLSINISNSKGAIIFKISEQFTCFTVMTFVPRFTALAGARIYVTIFTVDIWTGYWTFSSIVFSWKTSFEKVMLLYFSLEFTSFELLRMFLTQCFICQIQVLCVQYRWYSLVLWV